MYISSYQCIYVGGFYYKNTYMYISSSSSCPVVSTDFPDSLSFSLSLNICLYHPSLLAGPLDYIPYPNRAVVERFLLVIQHLHVRVEGSIGECR